MKKEFILFDNFFEGSGIYATCYYLNLNNEKLISLITQNITTKTALFIIHKSHLKFFDLKHPVIDLSYIDTPEIFVIAFTNYNPEVDLILPIINLEFNNKIEYTKIFTIIQNKLNDINLDILYDHLDNYDIEHFNFTLTRQIYYLFTLGIYFDKNKKFLKNILKVRYNIEEYTKVLNDINNYIITENIDKLVLLDLINIFLEKNKNITEYFDNKFDTLSTIVNIKNEINQDINFINLEILKNYFNHYKSDYDQILKDYDPANIENTNFYIFDITTAENVYNSKYDQYDTALGFKFTPTLSDLNIYVKGNHAQNVNISLFAKDDKPQIDQFDYSNYYTFYWSNNVYGINPEVSTEFQDDITTAPNLTSTLIPNKEYYILFGYYGVLTNFMMGIRLTDSDNNVLTLTSDTQKILDIFNSIS